MGQHSNAYQAFFQKSESGKFFMEFLNDEIGREHERAEKEPESARDHTQRAKGLRTVVEHISVTAKEDKPNE